MQTPVALLDAPDQIGALAHPVRIQILDALRQPDSAAGLARAFGKSRQFVSYHLKELARVDLVRRAGERRKGNFLEQLYQARARRFVVSARFATDPDRLAAVFRDQVALAQLAELGERLQRDAAGLIELAACEGSEIPSATVEAEVGFRNEQARADFMGEYIDAVKQLLAKHGDPEGQRFRVAMTAYPELGDSELVERLEEKT